MLSGRERVPVVVKKSHIPRENGALSVSNCIVEQTTLRPTDPVSLRVQFKSIAPFKACVIDQCALHCPEDRHFDENFSAAFDINLPPRKTCEVVIQLQPRQEVFDLRYLTEKKELILFQNVDDELVEQMVLEVTIPLEPYIAYLRLLPPIRALLYGFVGVGKSSLVCAFKTLFEAGNAVCNCETLIGGAESSLTRVIGEFGPYGAISLVDVPGMEKARPDLYNVDKFERLAKGIIGAGTTIEELGNDECAEQASPPCDLILFVTTPQTTMDLESNHEMMKYMQRASNMAGDIPAMVALTQIDTVDGELRRAVFQDHESVAGIVQTSAAAAKVPAMFVLPFVNYTAETEKTWVLTHAAYVLAWNMRMRTNTTAPVAMSRPRHGCAAAARSGQTTPANRCRAVPPRT